MRPTRSSLIGRSSRARCPPIDRCWGVPVLGALASLVVCAPASYMGLLFVFFVEDYGLSRAQASWPQNVLIVGSQLSGLVVGALQHRFSIASIAVMSSVLASAALVASAFSRHVVWMSISLGAMYGLGMGMFLTCVCIYSMMLFDKYRGTAVSLIYIAWSVSGIYAPALLSCLRHEYSLQGGLLICGALLLHAVPLSMLLQDPLDLQFNYLKNLIEIIFSRTFTERNGEYLKAEPFTGNNLSTDETSSSAEITRLPARTPRSSLIAVQPHPVCIEDGVLYSEKIGSHQEANLSGIANSGPPCGVLKATELLLHTTAFYVFLVAAAVGEYSLMAFAMTIVDYAMDKGVELDAAALLIMLGAVGQILGRLLIVPLSDLAPITRYPLFTATFAVEAICALSMPYVLSVPAIFTLRIIETLMQGFAGAVRGILLVHYVGIETVATCSGLFGFALIPLSLGSASIIGFFRDRIGSYDGFYWMLAAVNTVAAVVLCVFLLFDWKRSRRLQNPSGGNHWRAKRLYDGGEPLATQA